MAELKAQLAGHPLQDSIDWERCTEMHPCKKKLRPCPNFSKFLQISPNFLQVAELKGQLAGHPLQATIDALKAREAQLTEQVGLIDGLVGCWSWGWGWGGAGGWLGGWLGGMRTCSAVQCSRHAACVEHQSSGVWSS